MVNVINVEKQRKKIIKFIRDYFLENGGQNAILGISGGKDSTIAAALLVDALGPDRVIGVLMPDGNQIDIADSYEVCECLGIKYHTIDIKNITEAMNTAMRLEFGSQGQTAQVTSNIPPRIRMTVLYAVAASVGGRVCNTSNKSEGYVGWSTKWGDGAGDFALFRNLCVRDVLAIGEWYVQQEVLPNHLVYKAPADGLTGSTDEAAMGLTYEMIDSWILDREMPESNEDYINMMNRHSRNLHKVSAIQLPAPKRITDDMYDVFEF